MFSLVLKITERLFLWVLIVLGGTVMGNALSGAPASSSAQFVTGLSTVILGLLLYITTLKQVSKQDAETLRFDELADLIDSPVRVIKRNTAHGTMVEDRFVYPSTWTEQQKIEHRLKNPTYK